MAVAADTVSIAVMEITDNLTGNPATVPDDEGLAKACRPTGGAPRRH